MSLQKEGIFIGALKFGDSSISIYEYENTHGFHIHNEFGSVPIEMSANDLAELNFIIAIILKKELKKTI